MRPSLWPCQRSTKRSVASSVVPPTSLPVSTPNQHQAKSAFIPLCAATSATRSIQK